MKKALIVTSVASMIEQFNILNIELLKKMGYKVEVACNFELGNTISSEKIVELKNKLARMKVVYHQVDFSRKMLNIFAHVKALNQLQEIVNKENYSFIHCHAPIAGLISRTIRFPKKRIIYTAHGFHFYKGAPIKNWILFYPLEFIAAMRTGTLITINREDYELAKSKLRAQTTAYVHGVGLTLDKFKNRQKCDLERFKNFDDDLILLSIGELNDNKNHEVVINELEKIKDKHFVYLICGLGNKKEYLQELVSKKGLTNKVVFLGYRTDIPELLLGSDIYIHPSKREGLPVSVMEAMYSGLPICCSDIRGNRDLVSNNVNGFLVDLNDNNRHFSYFLLKLFSDVDLRIRMGIKSKEIINPFLERNVCQELYKIYSKF